MGKKTRRSGWTCLYLAGRKFFILSRPVDSTTLIMADDNADMLFDPTMKKKKKKKTINLEELDAMNESAPSQTENQTTETSNNNVAKEKKIDDDLDLADFSNMKKKKKKKKPLDLDAAEETTMGDAETVEKPKVEKASLPDDLDLDEDFSKMKKKKKKKKNVLDLDALAESLPTEGDDNADTQAKDKQNEAAEDDNREYTYEELLKRVFDIMRAKNPAMVEGGKRKFVMK